ncbi:hypothetical protein [Bosea sp. ANAM02]|uniref:hypothetical protein n=1 Tax=Bosea sp. ANAM02 TaxID=2020412 RepID=UPI00140ECAE9|nr:hypothetical protein [Bosea sp. ANAM02]BCB19853.1 hypothetical protein OCUBac02_27470 [Bosea sp. ANAM02]
MLPLSIRRELERLERKIAALEVDENLDLEVHEALQSVSHVMDRIMAAIWDRYGAISGKKNRPNIYFPSSPSREHFDDRLKQMGLSHLEDVDPELFSIVLLAQQFQPEGEWVKLLKKIANLKHERPPEIKIERKPSGIGIGRGRHVYIERLETGAFGEIKALRGWESDDDLGPRRPLSVSLLPDEIKHILEGTHQDPRAFAKNCCGLTKSIAAKVFDRLSKG